jgi:hypothetical protein
MKVMSMALQMSADQSGVLNVNATGKFSLEEAERTFVEMISTAMQHRVAKVFFDGRAIEGNPHFMERFYYGEFAAQTVKRVYAHDRAPRFAYVLKEPLLDPRRLGEMVALGRGMDVMAFDNVEQARAWLGIAPANETD